MDHQWLVCHFPSLLSSVFSALFITAITWVLDLLSVNRNLIGHLSVKDSSIFII